MKAVSAILTASLISSAAAFAPSSHQSQSKIASASVTSLAASFDPLNLAEREPEIVKSDERHVMKFAATAAASFLLHPLAAIAEEADNYEYGAVDAPIGIAWGAGVLVILSALLPLAMQGGEEAFEEMKDQESDTWGSGNSNRLNKKK